MKETLQSSDRNLQPCDVGPEMLMAWDSAWWGASGSSHCPGVLTGFVFWRVIEVFQRAFDS